MKKVVLAPNTKAGHELSNQANYARSYATVQFRRGFAQIRNFQLIRENLSSNVNALMQSSD
jgi:uncharacterized protein YhjY with autotransporter beta-barrel domain